MLIILVLYTASVLQESCVITLSQATAAHNTNTQRNTFLSVGPESSDNMRPTP